MRTTRNTTTTKTAVITGASSGIGYASARRMVRAGWQVFATVRKAEDGERLRAEIGPEVTPIILDVQDRSSIDCAAEQVSALLNERGLNELGLDGLVNVAGIGMVRPLEYVSRGDRKSVV